VAKKPPPLRIIAGCAQALKIPFVITTTSHTWNDVIDGCAFATALLACVLITLQDS
jgi:hypothetical protein